MPTQQRKLSIAKLHSELFPSYILQSANVEEDLAPTGNLRVQGGSTRGVTGGSGPYQGQGVYSKTKEL